MPKQEDVTTIAHDAPFIAPIARAVKDDRVTALAAVLTELTNNGVFKSDLFLPPNPGRYARNLLYREPSGGFVIVAMTWGPGQGSPLHDHAGLWGAEVVVDGAMRETTFELLERADEERYRFARGASRISKPCMVSVLNPPLEYHDFGNAATDEVARTVHVYGGDLTVSQAFTNEGNGWWRSRRVELHYDL
jgi:3-mercaptopropionate dioxygenase